MSIKVKLVKLILLSLILCLTGETISAQSTDLEKIFQKPPESAKPWIFWYWMHSAVTREGITADLESMKENGIGGAYLMPIKGADSALFNSPVQQLSPEWWKMVVFAAQEADRLGLKLAMHFCDGFAIGGGPWITPELSMQKVVWTDTLLNGHQQFNDLLKQPESYHGYYRDIAVLAFPTPEGSDSSSYTIPPEVTTSIPNISAVCLARENNRESIKSSAACWIQYSFKQPFTCRSVKICTNGNNYQAQRLILQVSDDGQRFRQVQRLEAPRHGWQDTDADHTYSIVPVTARYYRFVYDKSGSEPGSEDLDAAKWKPVLKLNGIELSGKPVINQYEGKNGEVWRIGTRTTSEEVNSKLCIPLDKIINLTNRIDSTGHLKWDVPNGKWTILRIGHTSTGHTNATGGAGSGLECDKFNPEAVRIQFDHWYGEAIKQAGPELAKKVLKIFHVDSWECGSQNWSSCFRDEFKLRRGYDLLPYLPVMAGIPVQSADVSERFLHDVRQTIAELLNDNFFGTLTALAHKNDCEFSAESVAPTMVSDGMLHFSNADIPMGEFWLHSPTHDKPNDMLDAVSGAHIYGKQIVQAEAFTELKIGWNEYPAMLKTLQDRSYALGINRLVFHVAAMNPWTDRKPGMTLDGVGLFLGRNQTWLKPGRAWTEYSTRCQALLQQGHPVSDIAVFTGEEIPRRAILPDRLVSTLPGIMGEEVVAKEQQRLANNGQPLQEKPSGVISSANMTDAQNWPDPLRGYAYDSFNADALIRLAKVENGKIVLPGGAAYSMLVLPESGTMYPDKKLMSPQVADKIYQLAQNGATIMINSEQPVQSAGLSGFPGCDQKVRQITDKLWNNSIESVKGKIVQGPFNYPSFHNLGLDPDFKATESGQYAEEITWTHRAGKDFDIYFVSNQQGKLRKLNLSLRISGRIPELWDPLTGEIQKSVDWESRQQRTEIPLQLEAEGSIFVIFRQPVKRTVETVKKEEIARQIPISGKWTVSFDTAFGGPEKPVTMDTLADWSANQDSSIRYYSGTAEYSIHFQWKTSKTKNERVYLNLGKVYDIAEVKINGVSCGTAWTSPWQTEITRALKPGNNDLIIEVTNTWYNRLAGDMKLPKNKRITCTNAAVQTSGKALLPSGLIGPVSIIARSSVK